VKICGDELRVEECGKWYVFEDGFEEFGGREDVGAGGRHLLVLE
jgi:hypothetical protein